MGAKTTTFEALKSALRKKEFSPVYVLHGEEGYFVDALVKEFENVLPDDEKEFNLNVLYAPRIDMSQVPEMCHRVPMFSDRQIVIIKEAQAVGANNLKVLNKYLEYPSPSTVLVVAGRGDVLKGDFMSTAKKSDHVTLFESKKIYEKELPGYITSFIKSRGLSVDPKALSMLSEYIGTDLSRLYNEIDKLIDILGPNAMVTPEAIERHIGFSKSFNAFELVEALANKDSHKVYRIADYFRANPKAVPLVMATASIFSFFSDLLVTYFAKDKSERGLMAALGIKWPVQFKKFAAGRINYNAFQVIEIIRAIRAFDRQSKGADSRRPEHDLFRELMHHILTAPGNLFPAF